MWTKLLFATLLFCTTSCQKTAEFPTAPTEIPPNEKIHIPFHDLPERALYLGAGGLFGTASFLARVGWGVCQLSPWAQTTGNECLLLSDVCSSVAGRAISHAFRGISPLPSWVQMAFPSHGSWHRNRLLLSQVPTSSQEEEKLLLFLQRRWLAKSTGYYSSLINWMCPCFGISMQVHPETTNSYARDPSNKTSKTYESRVSDWKHLLPHPEDYPLLLTRPFDCGNYLPAYVNVSSGESPEAVVERAALKMQNAEENTVVDFTSIFSGATHDKEGWLKTWKSHGFSFSKLCKERGLDQTKVLCIQRLEQEGMGGIRILPLKGVSAKGVEQQYEFLLHWISKFGLSANRVEMDRPTLSSNVPLPNSSPSFKSPSKEEFVSYLNSFSCDGKFNSPEKFLMVKGTLQVLEGLCASITDDKWNEITQCRAKSAIVELSFSKIKEQLALLAEEKEDALFYAIASHIEQIQGDLTPLLEIFSPFTAEDFPSIYRALLTSTPKELNSLIVGGVHSTGMTSLAGILKAAERMFGHLPRVLYGENTYFEVMRALELASHGTSVQEAKAEDWIESDLLVAQFNPVLRRIDFEITEYKAEDVEETVRQSLNARCGKPFILALDCTLDYLDSPRAAHLLATFQKEIEMGTLNVICFRSGIKFDLFGLDNYCGAPFYMIHNQEEKWGAFDSLLTDPVLQTDPLSLNWFCLAYRYAVPHLEQYRSQVFDNTRALLNKVPRRLLCDKTAHYRIIPMQPGVDPAFIDIKIFGLLHELRGSLVGGALTVKCMEKKHPMFYRPSLGFYHPNISILFGDDCTTIRLTLGLDPSQVEILADCFATIDALNGPSLERYGALRSERD